MNSATIDVEPTELNHRREEKKAGGGFLLHLMGSDAGSGWGALGKVAAGSGLLAAKAGLVGLIVAGGAVAAGVGLIGYKVFGPGAEDRIGQKAELFSPRPAVSSSADEKDSSSNDSQSPSLNSFVKANAGSLGGRGEAENAVPAPPSISVASGRSNRANVMGNKAAVLPVLKKSAGSPSSGSSDGSARGSAGLASSAASSGAAFKLRPSDLKMRVAAGSAKTAAFQSITGRRLGEVRGTAALAQLRSAGVNQYGAASSGQAGGTYDGSLMSRPGLGGAGLGSRVGVSGGGSFGDQPTYGGKTNTKAVSSGGADCLMNPDSCAKDVTPWASELKQAELFLALALVLLFIGAKLKTTGNALADQIVKGALAAAVVFLGVKVMLLGAQISGGQYGQKLQGGLLSAAGLGVTLAAGALFMGTLQTSETMQGVMKAVLYIGGGAALAALAVVYYSPPRSYPPGSLRDGCWKNSSCAGGARPNSNQSGSGPFAGLFGGGS